MTEAAARIAVIGFGAMGRSLIASLNSGCSPARVDAVLLQEGTPLPDRPDILTLRSTRELLGWRPTLVVECAGHEAIRNVVPDILRAGADVIVASIGALCDRTLRDTLERASADGGGRLSPVSGAIGGLDVLRAARLAGLDAVSYCGIKPCRAWKATPAEKLVDLDALTEPVVFFRGDAAQAATLYPKNANVTAAVALAGIGFESTQVTLVADPTISENSHRLEASGAFGSLSVTLRNIPFPDNPKTSWLAALSVEQAVLSHFQTVRY